MSCRGSIRKFVRLFNVKNAMPEINISNFKKVNFKNFLPPSRFPRNLGNIHDTRIHVSETRTRVAPRIFSLLCTSFYFQLPPLFLSIHSSFLRIHSRIFKFQRNDFSSSVHLFFAESTLESSRYQLYELFIRFESRNKSWQPNIFDSPVSSNYSLFLPSSIQFRVDLIIRIV